MKQPVIWGLVAFLAVGGGVLGALQLNSFINRRNSDLGAFLTRELPKGVPTRVVEGAPFDFTDAAEALMPSVVSIDTIIEGRSIIGRTVVRGGGSGSGVVLTNDGFIVTNNHVVEGATRFIVSLSDETTYEATLVGTDPRTDLAVLKVDATGLNPATLSDDTLRIGEWVLAIGNPLGFENTVSVGVVSSLDRVLEIDENSVLLEGVQTDAAINQGNSGGALANARGELVGINSAIASNSGGGSIGIGFAIPVSRMKRVSDELIQNGRVDYGILAVQVVRMPEALRNPRFRSELQQASGSVVEPPETGAVIEALDPNGPAAQAGIRPYDVITKVDGVPVKDAYAFLDAMLDKRAGDSAEVEVWSSGATRTVTVTLARLPE